MTDALQEAGEKTAPARSRSATDTAFQHVKRTCSHCGFFCLFVFFCSISLPPHRSREWSLEAVDLAALVVLLRCVPKALKDDVAALLRNLEKASVILSTESPVRVRSRKPPAIGANGRWMCLFICLF